MSFQILPAVTADEHAGAANTSCLDAGKLGANGFFQSMDCTLSCVTLARTLPYGFADVEQDGIWVAVNKKARIAPILM